jgi:hypothetical protein
MYLLTVACCLLLIWLRWSENSLVYDLSGDIVWVSYPLYSRITYEAVIDDPKEEYKVVSCIVN